MSSPRCPSAPPTAPRRLLPLCPARARPADRLSLLGELPTLTAGSAAASLRIRAVPCGHHDRCSHWVPWNNRSSFLHRSGGQESRIGGPGPSSACWQGCAPLQPVGEDAVGRLFLLLGCQRALACGHIAPVFGASPLGSLPVLPLRCPLSVLSPPSASLFHLWLREARPITQDNLPVPESFTSLHLQCVFFQQCNISRVQGLGLDLLPTYPPSFSPSVSPANTRHLLGLHNSPRRWALLLSLCQAGKPRHGEGRRLASGQSAAAPGAPPRCLGSED